MSDVKLRELERRWKETGTPEAEAAYLQERVRVGHLSRERLELAAYCGHRAAITLTPNPLARPVTAFSWLSGFGRRSLDEATRAACNAMLALDSYRPQPIDERWKQKVDAARAWLACPCDEHLEAILRCFPSKSERTLDRAVEVSCIAAVMAKLCDHPDALRADVERSLIVWSLWGPTVRHDHSGR